MEKKKLSISDLKVKSFVTVIENAEAEEIKGGVPHTENGRAIRKHDFNNPWNIRLNAWTVSEIRNDGREYSTDDGL